MLLKKSTLLSLVVVAAIALAGSVRAATAQTTHKSTSKTQASASKKPHAKTTHKSSHHKKTSRKTSKNWRHHGQQKIDAERAREIQDALIRAHYLNGEPSGEWDAATQKALQRYQADNGWQSKSVPDSRALIKLGLGPDHEHLLNPESAMTTAPAAAASTPTTGAKITPVDTAPVTDSHPQN